MGQAKQRGTFEQRKAQGEIKRAEEERKRRAERAAYEASLTPEQRARRTQFGLMLAAFGSHARQYL